MHRFFGAVSPRTLRPDATFRDLREADGDTGNVEENRSLYWNPVIYKVATVSTLSTVSTQDIYGFLYNISTRLSIQRVH